MDNVSLYLVELLLEFGDRVDSTHDVPPDCCFYIFKAHHTAVQVVCSLYIGKLGAFEYSDRVFDNARVDAALG